MAAEYLLGAGFSVLEAEHAGAALNILAARGTHVHVLFTDIHMPGSMNGLALAHHAHRNFPWIAVLVASGAATPAKHELPAGSRFLPKPYDHGHVVASIREIFNPPLDPVGLIRPSLAF